MKYLILLVLGVVGVAGWRQITSEELVAEDATVSAQVLPLDQQNAERAFETATFGLG